MAARLLIFQAEDLRNLLVHYTEGLVPLDSEILEVGVSKLLPRLISLTVQSKDWEDTNINPVSGELQPLQLFYEGRRTMSWEDKNSSGQWSAPGAVEAPRRQ